MTSVFAVATEEARAKRDFVLATVVNTWGSTPQKSGARLLVRQDGSGVGTLGGGCVEGDIWFEAKELLTRGGSAKMRDYTLNEDLAAKDGLVCGGTMRFLIEPIRNDDSKFYELVLKASSGGMPVAIANVVASGALSKVQAGARMLLREDGSRIGTMGDQELDRLAFNKARNLMAMGKCEYVIDDSGVEYFIEARTTPPTLVLIGGGHVSKAVATLGHTVGMRTVVFDDREEFSNKERFPNADLTVVGKYADGFDNLSLNPNSFIVIATRGHRHDVDATASAMRTSVSYIGLLGSRRKSILIFEDLLKQGFSESEIRQVRSPMGLDIGARTPEEIAVSIIAEILAFRLGGKGHSLTLSDELLNKAITRAARTTTSQKTSSLV